MVEKETTKYTRPSWKSSFQRSVRAECFFNKATAVKARMTRSKPMAVSRELCSGSYEQIDDLLKKKVVFNNEGFVAVTEQDRDTSSHSAFTINIVR